jgi:Na+/H+-dicarboxylate symporter
MSSEQASHKLATKILWGLVIGIILGIATVGLGRYSPGILTFAQGASTHVLNPFGQVFLRLLFFVVIPLVFASLALGIVQLGNIAKLGPLAGRTAGFFFMNMAIGAFLALIMMNVLKPGGSLDASTQEKLRTEFVGDAQTVEETHKNQDRINFNTLVEMFMPRNLMQSIVQFQILPLILFAILLGAAGTQLAEDRRKRFEELLSIVAELMTKIVHFALRLAPYAVPALIFSAIVNVGLDFLISLAYFVVASLAIMVIHLFGTMSVWLKIFTKRSPIAFFRSIRAVLITAFSTSSSNATLPTSLQVTREGLGVSSSTSGFVLPLGATMNMSGTALYEGCVVLFIAQVYGVDLSIASQAMLLLLTVFSAIAVAGIPGGSLPVIAGLLISFDIPAEGLALIIGVDRLLDMARTTVNVGADIVTATIVDEQLRKKALAA